jgi:hypothetical protein
MLLSIRDVVKCSTIPKFNWSPFLLDMFPFGA